MVSRLEQSPQTEIIYPDSDGKPMADNTLQFRWITTIKHNLEWLFSDKNNVFVAGDLLWYPVEGDNKLCQAPDVMIVIGRPKGDRGSYQQWKEDNIAPQVVFEILSPSNTQTEMNKKLLFYDRYGVEEYYIYNPDKNDFSGLLRAENRLEVIDIVDNWISPRLGIRFELVEPESKIYYPNGKPFTTYVEIAQQLQQAEERAEQEYQRAERLAQLLREAGLEVD